MLRTSPWRMPKTLWHKGDPGVTHRTCGAVHEERAQVILVWVRAPGVGNRSHPRWLGGTRVRPCYEYTMACRIWNAEDHLNRRCELGDMTIWVGRWLGRALWYNSGIGVAPKITKVWTGMISSTFAQMWQVRNPLASTWSVDKNGVVSCKIQSCMPLAVVLIASNII